MAMAASTSLHAFGLPSAPEDADEDIVLEDAGFFSGPIEAQKALNELGLQPSPPKARRYMDEEDDMPFDLDRELEAEDEQEEEEEHISQRHHGGDVPEGTDAALESNGLLQPTDECEPSSPVQHSHTVEASSVAVPTMLSREDEDKMRREMAQQARVASTSRAPATTARSVDVEKEDEELGQNGLPKYIAAGTATATLLDGSIIRFEKKRRMKGWKPKATHFGAGATNLLSQPVHQIVDRIEARAALRVVQETERTEQPSESSESRKTTEMWQERYRPQRFTELVGEERTHRDVIRWIKEWDACVFGRKAHTRKKWRKEEEESEASIYVDKWSRPRERVLLLGGPAGMGKTTLAHVAAKQCGYLVHELNASDDRSAQTVEDRVRDALESKSLRQDADLPTCLILDEIDGATGGRGEEGGGFIKALIKLVEQGNGAGRSGKKGGRKQRPLLRPIVCICNDPYSPNLRALRPYSKLIRLGRPSTPLLTRRLKQICEQEDIPADSKGLITLVDICQGDIRSCLNVLQLMQSNRSGLTADTFRQPSDGDEMDDSVSLALGVKDGNVGIHQVWSLLFQTLTTREKAQQRGRNGKGSVDQDEGARIVASIINSGEMSKILAGCFEHYPSLSLVDDGWWRYERMHDWIHWYEYIDKTSWEVGAQTEMWSYLPWSFVGWKYLFANTGNALPEFPRVDYQNHLKRTAFDEVTADLIASLPATTRSQFNTLSTVTELGPSLVTLLSPDVKLINSQLVRQEERSTLSSVVNIMQHCNLNFVMDKNEQAQSYYRLEPPLEVFVQYEGKKSNVVGPARFQLRQMIVSELNSARVKARRLQMGKEANEASRAQDVQGYKDAYAKGLGGGADHKPKLARIAVDFFGRPVAPKGPVQQLHRLPPDGVEGRQNCPADESLAPSPKRAKLKVFYNYHEGYSNAVRKPVKMASLLL